MNCAQCGRAIPGDELKFLGVSKGEETIVCTTCRCPDEESACDFVCTRWRDFDGSSSDGMAPEKLYRMEDIRWEPPNLYFVIERHGGTVLGSTRAELQYWQVDLQHRTATIIGTGRRQLKPMAPRVQTKPIAKAIVESILAGRDDDRYQRRQDGSVKILTGKIFPTGSGCAETIRGRRKRLCNDIEELLGTHGWERFRAIYFRPPDVEEE